MFLNMTSFPQSTPVHPLRPKMRAIKARANVTPGCDRYAVLGLSGTYDEQLWLDQAILVSTEGRALHNKVERTLIFAAGGLTFFSPDINIFRCAFPPRPGHTHAAG